MTEKELAIETKMRGLASEMTKEEGRKMLELMLERMEPDAIVEAIQLVKASFEVEQIQTRL